MTKQDERVTEESLGYLEMYFEYVAADSHQELTELLECLPDLIYARDEQGNTALYCAVGIGSEATLETARILMENGAEIDNSHVGIAFQLIKEPSMKIKMAKVLGLGDLNPYSNALEEADEAIAASRAYLSSGEVGRSEATLRKFEKESESKAAPKKGDCIVMRAEDTTSEQNTKAIFSNIPPLNMDQEKEINKMMLDVNPFIEEFSFAPIMFESLSSDSLSTIVVPKEIAEMTYEQFSNIFSGLYEYCFGSDA